MVVVFIPCSSKCSSFASAPYPTKVYNDRFLSAEKSDEPFTENRMNIGGLEVLNRDEESRVRRLEVSP